MSCMVMNPEPLAALANAVETRLNCDYNYWGFEAPDSLYRELADCKTSCTYYAEDIYRRLYSVNIRAYNGRYADHEEPADEEAPTIPQSLSMTKMQSTKTWNICQLYNSMMCMNYHSLIYSALTM